MKIGEDYIGVCVVFICHDGQGNFVMHKRSQKCRDEQGKWDFGGGMLEFGEDPDEGVLREVKEEYCVRGSIEEALPLLSIVRENSGKKTHWISAAYIVRVDRGQVKNGDPDSIDEIGWFRLDSLPQPLHTAIPHRLKKHSDIFKKYAH
jgi:ADP-ribose pyrophosphatase YjhB (NUDIX family)